MDMQKTAFIIIDMQNDVLYDLVKTGPSVVPNIQKALEVCRKQGMPIIYLVRVHRKGGVDVDRHRLSRFKDKPFLVEGTKGADIVDGLKPLSSEYVVNKKRYSGFFQSDLLMLLMRLGINSLVISGVQTPNCVRATVTDALGYDYDVTVLKDATVAHTSGVHEANLFDMQNMGARIETTNDFIQSLNKSR